DGSSPGEGIGQITNVTIGGTTAGARNIISGNRGWGSTNGNGQPGITGNAVQGNYIGTDVTGMVAIANDQGGIAVKSAGNTIGGTTPGTGNLISGNVGSS